MKRREAVSTHAGLGFADALTIVFIILKLTGVINWSWLWVLSPFWISSAIVMVVLVVLFVAAAMPKRRK